MRILILSALLTMLLPGCGVRHIYQQPGTGTVLERELKGVHVAAPDADGKLVPGVADIPAGAVIVVPKDKITTK